jgi:hypothetical protein
MISFLLISRIGGGQGLVSARPQFLLLESAARIVDGKQLY